MNNWEEQYLEDIAYLKSEDNVDAPIYDRLHILDQTKRKWMGVITDIHICNENDTIQQTIDDLQLLPNSIRIHASTVKNPDYN